MTTSTRDLRKIPSPSFVSPPPASKPLKALTLGSQPTRKLKSTKPMTHEQTQKLHHKAKLSSRSTRILEDISNTSHCANFFRSDPTRKLDFCTPSKPKTKRVNDPIETSSSSSCNSSSDDDSNYSSDDTQAILNATSSDTRRIHQKSSPLVATNAFAPGLEYHFAVSSTVSSVAIAPNGKFLVVGFYNGMISLYPLTHDAVTFRQGVLVDQIMPRGMYTQIMVTVAIPQDGKFIFAGVYRGSTDIRAFEVDSIELPTSNDMLSYRSDDDNISTFGIPTATVISHTFSDAKLKGFAAVTSVTVNRLSHYHTEYRLLCGLGIKNIHLWRFYQQSTAPFKWTWECIFDKQTNGISLEFMTFHPTLENQILSKSEHQNVRIWYLKEEYKALENTVTVSKTSHMDVKQTTDILAIYGNYAYGGTESLVVVDLLSASRMELDLPLTSSELRAQEEALLVSRREKSLRARHPRMNRRRGIEDMNGPRHMRSVSKLASHDMAPFTVGRCSDGSVFYHQIKPETGLATPLEHIEGYEQFFEDPSLDFQAQYSDLTRVNTNGLLAVLPLPETDKEEWMIVAANQNELVVRSLNAFLHCKETKKEVLQSDSKYVVRSDLKREDSAFVGSSDVQACGATHCTHQYSKKADKLSLKRRRYERASTINDTRCTRQSSRCVAMVESSHESRNASFKQVKKVHVIEEKMAAVTTPKRTMLSTSAASPVVSISSSSSSSNPSTPVEQRKHATKDFTALQELSWTLSPQKHNMVTDRVTLSDTQASPQAQLVDKLEKRLDCSQYALKKHDVFKKESKNTAQSIALVDDANLPKQLESAIESVSLFQSDKDSLLTAVMYQYGTRASSSTEAELPESDGLEMDIVAMEQSHLLLQFAHENERLKQNFSNDRARLYKQVDCTCALHSKKTTTHAMNWRRGVAHQYHKRQHLARRHQKQLAAKFHELRASYAIQIQELLALQQMQAKALWARQQFNHLYRRLSRPQTPLGSASPLFLSTLPNHFVEATTLSSSTLFAEIFSPN
ncbi:hypothetical protein CCR75_001675 [Bremia lactucae]|uniref:Uncharacterized protein n=1 Tax=Bremia lactucae TaxID=4779 RepID=A0A976ID99_BRELC|nr:hypothetical protein CCR75_001675 [Bremia lactucae]